LLRRGLDIMDEMFPGFEAELEARGAQPMNWGTDIKVYTGGRWLGQLETELASKVASRVLIEAVLRERVCKLGNVQMLERTQVLGLLADASGERVVGLHVRERGGRAAERDLYADFVVDASGRGSKGSDWLQALGYEVPKETTVDADVGYSTRYFKKPKDKSYFWRVLYMPAKAPSTRGAGIFEVENDVWIASLGGFVGDHPPTDEEGWMEYARNLPADDFYEAVKDAEPIPEMGVCGYRRTGNYIRHFERMERFPAGFVLVGDAVCAFNPIYGQGMTSAAMGAQRLGEMLADVDKLDASFGKAFQSSVAKQCEPMWLISTGNDLQFEETIGDRPTWVERMVQKYVDAYLEVMADKPVMVEQFFHVQNLTAAPTTLLRPDLAARVLWDRVRPAS